MRIEKWVNIKMFKDIIIKKKIIAGDLDNEDEAIEGEDIKVKIDESKFGRKKIIEGIILKEYRIA